MADPVNTNVRILPDKNTMSVVLAEHVAHLIEGAVVSRGTCSIALAGGNTPRAMYECLAADYGSRLPWDSVHLFWGDERFVPPDHTESNYRMVRESLLDHIAIPVKNVHPMPTGYRYPEEAARVYANHLTDHFGAVIPRFDLILLGLGNDGHTASLFPGSPGIEERKRPVIVTFSPVEPRIRLTLTLPVLNHSAHVAFAVAGPGKASALRCARNPLTEPVHCPASAVRPEHGSVMWWLDEAAAVSAGIRA